MAESQNREMLSGLRKESRGDTYTMVLSPSCIENGTGTGVGLAVPFRYEIESVKDLIEEAVQLWVSPAVNCAVNKNCAGCSNSVSRGVQVARTT